MKSRKNFYKVSVIALFIFAFSFSIVAAFFNPIVAIIELSVTVLFLLAVIISWGVLKKETFSLFSSLEKKLSPSTREALESNSMPVCLVNDDDEIAWYNTAFALDVLGGENMLGKRFSESFIRSKEAENHLSYKSKKFTAFENNLNDTKEKFKILYLIDDTELKIDSQNFKNKKPSVIQIVVDNFEELLNSIDGSQKKLYCK